MSADQLPHHQFSAQRQRARASGVLPVPNGRVVPVHHGGRSDRYVVFYGAGEVGVHELDAYAVVWRLVCAVFDSAECDGVVWACEGVGEVFFLESYCEDLIYLLELYAFVVPHKLIWQSFMHFFL
jgi:hypothetical protein